ncbi:MAG TPA: dihydropteroate synthase [Cyclobacteriaceae bacterium]|nr:dihydropteroate synthase [Cyclobacteriaceae bacterium]
MQSKVFSSNKTLNLHGRLMDLGTPKVMGVLNVTPDSFYDGGRYTDEASILAQVEKMLRDGADVIDVGGYSTRPGAREISEEEELNRATNAIRTILKTFPEAVLSVDTFRSAVAKAAIREGASMINDISGGEMDKKMFDTVASLHVPFVLMHMRGTPQTMTHLSHYDNLMKDMTDYFHQKIHQLHQLGVTDIIIDPGFGFAKTPEQNFDILKNLNYFRILGKPVLAGLSRKSTIWRTLETSPEGSLNGTTVLNTVALLNGASFLRVHDVKEAVECIKLIDHLH